ncbi:hypothetical protein MTO96_000909 [Rhipicephalus appendiculatus]
MRGAPESAASAAFKETHRRRNDGVMLVKGDAHAKLLRASLQRTSKQRKKKKKMKARWRFAVTYQCVPTKEQSSAATALIGFPDKRRLPKPMAKTYIY